MLEKGPRAEGMIRYKHQPGLPFLPDGHGGRLLPQVYVWDYTSKRVKFSDDLIFCPGKKGLLQLLLLPDSLEDVNNLLTSVDNVTGNKYIRIEEATVLIQKHDVQPTEIQQMADYLNAIARVATGEEFAADPDLCRNRPEPKYYDPFRIRKDVGGMKFVVVRPDRFVYAACQTSRELQDILNGLGESLVPCQSVRDVARCRL